MARWFRHGAALVAAALAGALLAAAPAAARTNHALVVAVTDYPNLPPKYSLVGPNNDALLVLDYLRNAAPVDFAEDDITVLADGIDSDGSPTLAAIEQALADIAARAQAGDFVYMHFSGHGAQQPALEPGSEPDGLDEIFLPADTGLWQDRSKGVPAALADDRIGAALDAIRDKGAFVWLVIDACHSGTATRAAALLDEDVTERKVAFEDLMAPGAEMPVIEAVATRGDGARESALGAELDATGAAPARGGLVAFFAAQTVETTPEMLLPRGAADASKLGLFTHTLYTRLAQNPGVTYRQLGEAVLQAYAGDNRTRPTPLFEGALDTPVFGAEGAEAVRQWRLAVDGAAMTVPAGRLHRLAPGTRLAVLASPVAGLEEAVGYVEVTAAKNLSARVRPVSHDGLAALAPDAMPQNAYARLVELTVDFKLRVARPDATFGFDEAAAEVVAMLEAIVADERVPVSMELVAPGADADIRLAVLSERDAALLALERAAGQGAEASRASLGETPRLWFLPPGAEIALEPGRRPPSIGLVGADAAQITDEIGETLVKIFRATSLARLATASDFRPQQVSVGFSLWRDGATEPLELSAVPLVNPGHQVHLSARNGSSQPVDINVLYVGSDFAIGHMYAERLHGGSEIELPLLEFTDTSFGLERMIVVLTEAQPLTPVEDLSFLEQVGVRQATRAVDHPQGFAGLLRDIGDAPATRGGMRIGGQSGPKGAVMVYAVETVPAAQ